MEYITADQLTQALPRIALLCLLSGMAGALLLQLVQALAVCGLSWLSARIERGDRIRIARFRANARDKLRNG